MSIKNHIYHDHSIEIYEKIDLEEEGKNSICFCISGAEEIIAYTLKNSVYFELPLSVVIRFLKNIEKQSSNLRKFRNIADNK